MIDFYIDPKPIIGVMLTSMTFNYYTMFHKFASLFVPLITIIFGYLLIIRPSIAFYVFAGWYSIFCLFLMTSIFAFVMPLSCSFLTFSAVIHVLVYNVNQLH